MMDEDQKCWKDMAKLMMKINKKETNMFNTYTLRIRLQFKHYS